MSRPVLGIDLGTTNSVVASIDGQGRVVILRNALGSEITPSVVFFEPGSGVVVGEEALQAAAAEPGSGVRLIKRQMGTQFPLMLGGQEHTPESVSALILRQLAAAAPGGLAGRPRVVITVPAYFGLAEREATYQAGVIAGLDVLELLDEPVAAAAHYGLATTGTRTILVYDLGGGTFDTTVLRITDGVVTVLATDGHHQLGGADVDQRLLDLVLERLEHLIPPAEFDAFAEDARRVSSLALDVEAAKKELSARTTRDVIVRTSAGRVTVTVSRGDLEMACGDLFDTTAEIIERVLASARSAGAGAIDDVIMVGGSSRIPALSVRLTSLLGITPRLVEPDLAVAKGAALRAHQILATPQLAALTQSTRRPAAAGARADHYRRAPRGGHPGRGQPRPFRGPEFYRAPGSGEHAAAGQPDRGPVRHHPQPAAIGPDPGLRAGRLVPVSRGGAQPPGSRWRADQTGGAACGFSHQDHREDRHRRALDRHRARTSIWPRAHP